MEAKSSDEEFCGHLRLTAIKYLSRAGLKIDEIEDYEKAAWYLNRLIEKKKKLQDAKNNMARFSIKTDKPVEFDYGD